MKTIATLFVFMCALTLLGTTALGQITITSADVSAKLAVGKILANKIDKVTTTQNIGKHALTSWDFSSLGSDSSLTFTSVDVSGTPFVSSFPGATNALRADINFFIPALSGTPIPATAYAYFKLSATSLLNPGQGASGTGAWTGASALITNIPADVYYKLPLTYGTTWTSTYLDTTVITLGTFQIAQPGIRYSSSYIVDAYGPMTIPGGSVHDALRIKKTDSIVTISSGTTSKRVGYIFLARDGASVQVTVGDLSAPDSGSIVIQPTASWNGQVFALPIQLTSFNASQNTSGAGVLLRWSTLSEVNNYGFEVQRGALSSGDFVTVSGAVIPGHGTTTVPRDYSYADRSAQPGTWYYRLKQIDLDGAVHYSDPAKVDVQPGGTGQDVPAVFSLAQNFPNPFNPETTIRYSLPSRSHVVLAVYNALGERVAVLAEGEQESGSHEVRFNGSALASGVYFYRLQSTGFVETKKLSLLR
jgi:hypothetical protein